MDNDKEARIAIEKFCESFEKEILMEFDKAYEESDPRVMAVSFFLTEYKFLVLTIVNSIVQRFYLNLMVVLHVFNFM